MRQTACSEQMFERACRVLPGGVNSPVRAFRSVGRCPVFVKSAKGSHMIDADGNDWLDYIGSWGPMILGHAHPDVIQAAQAALTDGVSYGLPTQPEVEMAELMTAAYPGMDMVRMVNSGTEATMSALRAARGFTGRSKIIKFEGCYHGHSDGLLVQAGSGALTFGTPTSPGVPADVVRHTLVCRYNDLESVEQTLCANHGEVAAIIVEPVAANMGVVPPVPGFLQGLRRLCDEHGALLIFDEVITGFRLAFGGAAQRFGVTPDLACFGKIIGAGMPVGAYGGKRDVMQMVSPSGPVYQAGTLSGNPLAMRTGLCQLRYLQSHPEVYAQIEARAAALEQGMKQAVEDLQLGCMVTRCGSLLTLFFTPQPMELRSYDDVKQCSTQQYAAFFSALFQKGILIAPSQFEALFIGAAHTDEEIARTAAEMREALRESVKA
ncbi:MAG TPA: glutamate-1-semialdehyde 2,1-aminomutase [Candidatus Ruthenibacterium avium]|uniref:Glutamate-1-semialdehyde 2,1-aminomutase n=1 Tax=Candidatus Ruthenibacterium avium TaxID=2838751 RepID=A0A9D2M576_9FIRM|nr:glutamate-1-semialdehyde 2,1-aminomutase [Candidatus Ruthenibacterium avium]